MGPVLRLTLAVLIAIAVTACGDDSEPAAPPTTSTVPKPAPPPPPASTCAQSDRGIGRIEPRPVVASGGESVRLVVHNASPHQLTFGVAYEFERLVGGRWEPATDAVYGPNAAFPELAIIVEPGDVSRDQWSVVELPPDLEPGTYRAIKRLTYIEDGFATHRATVCGAFTVR